jgi:uncharacterized damage-inducible protein DinB
MNNTATDPRYPIGKYEPQPYSDKQLADWLNDIRLLPGVLENAVTNLDEHQFETPYREGGWTIKQLVHHVADSHINAYVRFKLGLTENRPTIKPYEEKEWAKLKDSAIVPVNISITLLYALHARLSEVLKSMTREDWDKSIIHPDHNREITLWHLLGMYSWHGRHHTAHITTARQNHGWN